MSHGPATDWGEDKASGYKAKLGVYLFISYAIVYFVFVAINVLSPKFMGTILFAGLNIAIVYGIGLILLAIIMGLIYNHICSQKEYEMNRTEE